MLVLGVVGVLVIIGLMDGRIRSKLYKWLIITLAVLGIMGIFVEVYVATEPYVQDSEYVVEQQGDMRILHNRWIIPTDMFVWSVLCCFLVFVACCIRLLILYLDEVKKIQNAGSELLQIDRL